MSLVKFAASITVALTLLACRGQRTPDQLQNAGPPRSRNPAVSATSASACTEPMAVSRVQPEYPLYHTHLDGEYVFKVRVTADGYSESVEVVRAANAAWSLTGADAVRKWRWKPAVCSGVPSPGETIVTMRVSTGDTRSHVK